MAEQTDKRERKQARWRERGGGKVGDGTGGVVREMKGVVNNEQMGMKRGRGRTKISNERNADR